MNQYKFKPRFQGNRKFRSNNRSQQGGRGFRAKTFDPSQIIAAMNQTLETQEPVAEFVPTHKFSDFQLEQKLQSNIVGKGYKTPTPIQDQIIPSIVEGRDVVGMARTGSGKTAAFLIPLINKVLKNPAEKVLILAPTRELAIQIKDELVSFTHKLNIYSVLCIGGVGMQGQIKNLSRNPHFVIATPGRIKDLERQRKINFFHFKSVVLDEVDHMLDIGFIHDVQDIVSKLNPVRQSMFFSATVNEKIEQIMKTFLKNPVIIKLESNTPTTHVHQRIVKVNGRQKFEVLEEMLRQKEFEKVIIFGRMKFGVERLSQDLIKRGFKAASIHGNKSQGQRKRALTDFKSGYVKILLATDVASRGLDIQDVTHVINYDLPESYEDYVHRIGRTGRADKRGTAVTFVS